MFSCSRVVLVLFWRFSGVVLACSFVVLELSEIVLERSLIFSGVVLVWFWKFWRSPWVVFGMDLF